MAPRCDPSRPGAGFLADLLARLRRTPAREQPPEQLVEATVAVVDGVLASLGLEGEGEEGEEGVRWNLQVGSAALAVDLRENEVLSEWTLEVRAPIVRLPERNLLAFYRRCLELNRIVVGCCLGAEGDLIVVAAERRLPGLGPAEFVEMLVNVASAADQFDDELEREFGAPRVGEDLAGDGDPAGL